VPTRTRPPVRIRIAIAVAVLIAGAGGGAYIASRPGLGAAGHDRAAGQRRDAGSAPAPKGPTTSANAPTATDRPTAALLASARTALAHAASYHIELTGPDGSGGMMHTSGDLSLVNGRDSLVEHDGDKVLAAIQIGITIYARANAAFWIGLGSAPGPAHRLAGHWVRLPATSWSPLTSGFAAMSGPSGVAQCLLPAVSGTLRQPLEVEYRGQPAYVLDATEIGATQVAGRVLLAADGRPLPLEVIETPGPDMFVACATTKTAVGQNAVTTIHLSRYGEPLRIRAPRDVISPSRYAAIEAAGPASSLHSWATADRTVAAALTGGWLASGHVRASDLPYLPAGAKDSQQWLFTRQCPATGDCRLRLVRRLSARTDQRITMRWTGRDYAGSARINDALCGQPPRRGTLVLRLEIPSVSSTFWAVESGYGTGACRDSTFLEEWTAERWRPGTSS
jgi:hypothetical protein